MAKMLVNSIFLLSKRAYAVAEESVRLRQAAAGKAAAAEEAASGSVPPKQKEIFWMRDPKTGNWIPENHFEEVDVVKLREKFLSNKHNL